ncbi:MAG TPA: hypothetical protein EYO31_09705 [Phycisphaerales bacterium]|nr:hypothetical protein [Phycisphaerales bacterium]
MQPRILTRYTTIAVFLITCCLTFDVNARERGGPAGVDYVVRRLKHGSYFRMRKQLLKVLRLLL